ncbi:hypothetical protein FRB91_009069 [Serendipita sp. 411]|nr:hypothetical protein FRB91_009069 [Serendipita sp. 411]
MAEKIVTYEEFQKHQQRENLWILLHGKGMCKLHGTKRDTTLPESCHEIRPPWVITDSDAPSVVYDVAKFLDEHPGGEEVIFAEAGKDATESFEDVGHSDDARAMLTEMLVGTFGGGDKIKQAPIPTPNVANSSTTTGSSSGPSPVAFVIPLACMGAYFAWRYYGQ